MGRKRNTVERLLKLYVHKTETCWEWTGAIAMNGYSKTKLNFKYTSGHRAFFEHYKGPISPGLQIDHLCKNKRCVNPEHLEMVTPRENSARSPGTISTINRHKLECNSGHLLSGDNLYMTPDGRRQCRSCKTAAAHKYNKKKEVSLAIRA